MRPGTKRLIAASGIVVVAILTFRFASVRPPTTRPDAGPVTLSWHPIECGTLHIPEAHWEAETSMGCPSADKPYAPPAASTRIADAITMTRMGCEGICPRYTVEAERSGRVRFVGGHFTTHPGCYEAQMPAADAEALFESIARSGYFDFPAVFESPCEDGPSTVTAVVANGHSKCVRNLAMPRPACGGPQAEPMFRIEALIDRSLQTSDLVGPRDSFRGRCCDAG